MGQKYLIQETKKGNKKRNSTQSSTTTISSSVGFKKDPTLDLATTPSAQSEARMIIQINVVE